MASPLQSLTATPYAPAGSSTPAAPASPLSKLTSTPYKAAPTPASPATPSYTPFQGKEPSGTFLGVADTKDPYSGRPYFAYQSPGEATTTDATRTAPGMDPEVAAPTPKTSFENPRMPSAASQAVRTQMGATPQEQLDHRMALAVGGSNDNANLKPIPTAQNQAAGKDEEKMMEDVQSGKMSLFEAQAQEAKNKGLPIPFTDAPQHASMWSDIVNAPDNSTLGTIRNSITGLPKGAEAVDKTVGDFGKSIIDGFISMYKNPSPLTQDIEKHIVPNVPGIKQIDEGVIRTFEPMFEPLSSDGAAAVVLRTPSLYNRFSDLAGQGQLNGSGGEVLSAMNKSNVQLIGDSAQAVLGAYMPDLLGVGEGASAGLASVVKQSVLHGAATGFTFGVAQAASAGITDPKEFGALVLKSTVGMALFNGALGTGLHLGSDGIPKAFNAIKPKAQELYHQAMTSTSPGFVKNPLAGNTEGHIPNEKTGDLEHPAIVEARARAQAIPETHTIDTPERHELRANIANKLYGEGAAKKNGRADIVIGLPAAGKSEKMARPLAETHGSLIVDSDAAKEHLPEYQNGIGASATHKESDKIAISILGKAVANKDNVVLPLVGKNVDKIQNTIDALKEAGYDVHLHHNDVPVEASKARAVSRFHETGRFVDPEYIHDVGLQPSETYDTLQGYAGLNGSSKISNDVPKGQRPVLIHQENAGLPEEHFQTGTLQRGRVEEQEGSRTGSVRGVSTGVSEEVSGKNVQVSLPPEENSELGEQIEAPQGPITIRDNIPISQPPKYDPAVTERNGGVLPPVNKGGLEVPEIDWSAAKDIGALRLSTDTMERNVEKIFGPQADKINTWGIEHIRANETARVKWANEERTNIQKSVVKDLGIKAGSKESALVQKFGEGQYVNDDDNLVPYTLHDLQKDAPTNWEDIQKASKILRDEYEKSHAMINNARAAQGIEPIGYIPNYFRHWSGTPTFLENFLPTSSAGKIPTSIAGITDYFKSRMPWASVAMRRYGVSTAYDAVGGFDNYLNSAGKMIFHTDSVQRGRLLEKYMRDTSMALENPDMATENNVAPLRQAYEEAQAAADDAVKSRDFERLQDKADEAYNHYKEAIADQRGRQPTDLNLQNFAQNLNDWTNMVSGKQARLDRAIESVVGRPALDTIRKMTRRFGLNVIGGNVSAAATHAIPMVYTLATVDTPAAFHGLLSTLSKPFMQDFSVIGGQESSFLTRRYARGYIEPSVGEKIATGISSPFRWADEFISHFAVASKFHEGIGDGLPASEAMARADNYAARVIGDRSTGNLPNLMNTKTLGAITQFQIEVNDNLHVLMHDVPRWAGHDPMKIAAKLGKFMVYSYLFNQALNAIKGSGKGLDPIDLGLTLAGLNDSGSGKDTLGKLEAFGTDLSKELPFASLISGGQIPVAQPFVTTMQDAVSGKYGAAVSEFASTFLSPVGGGVQALKTYKGIMAWRAGVVLDSSGKIIGTVPQTVPTFLQGTLFGTSAFASIKSSRGELANLSALIKTQQATAKAKNAQASSMATDVIGIASSQGNQAAQDQLMQIADQDPDMATRVLAAIASQKAGITKQDTMIKSLGVKNGQRAAYIKSQLSKLGTNEEKQQYLLDLANKKILTADVLQQVLGTIQ